MHHLHKTLRTCASSLATRRPSSLAAAAALGRPLLSLQQKASQPQQSRHSSHSPLGAQGPSSQRKKVTVGTLRAMHRRGEPIAVITAHDFPSAHVADAAGVDIVLVGDSLAMVALGMEDTSEVMVEEMLLHCRSVARATKAAFTVSLFFLFRLVLSFPSHFHPTLAHHFSPSLPRHLILSHPKSQAPPLTNMNIGW